MIKPDFDPGRIRKCELVMIEGNRMIQFIATGDRHKMMRGDDGAIQVIKLPEQGRDYRYGDPYAIEEALVILDKGHHDGHQQMAKQIRHYLAQLPT